MGRSQNRAKQEGISVSVVAALNIQTECRWSACTSAGAMKMMEATWSSLDHRHRNCLYRSSSTHGRTSDTGNLSRIQTCIRRGKCRGLPHICPMPQLKPARTAISHRLSLFPERESNLGEGIELTGYRDVRLHTRHALTADQVLHWPRQTARIRERWSLWQNQPHSIVDRRVFLG